MMQYVYIYIYYITYDYMSMIQRSLKKASNQTAFRRYAEDPYYLNQDRDWSLGQAMSAEWPPGWLHQRCQGAVERSTLGGSDASVPESWLRACVSLASFEVRGSELRSSTSPRSP